MKRKINTMIKQLKASESGMGVVEVILIILVLVGLAFIFKNQIYAIAQAIFGAIRSQVEEF